MRIRSNFWFQCVPSGDHSRDTPRTWRKRIANHGTRRLSKVLIAESLESS